MINFEPVADYVLLKPIPRGKTAGGLHIPDNAEHEPSKGLVMAVGPGYRSIDGTLCEVPVKVGDVIYRSFAHHEPMEITLGAVKYLVCRGRDIIAKVPKVDSE